MEKDSQTESARRESNSGHEQPTPLPAVRADKAYENLSPLPSPNGSSSSDSSRQSRRFLHEQSPTKKHAMTYPPPSPNAAQQQGEKRMGHLQLDGEDENEDGEPEEDKWIRVPLLRSPLPGEGPWLRNRQKATDWLPLFYDLAVVAVLTAFGSTNNISTPSKIPTYISYFVIISWIWTSQVHYDVRYQAEDRFHLLAKCLQIALFVYIGSASGNWDLRRLYQPDDDDSISAEEYAGRGVATEAIIEAARDSFTIVAICLLLSRVILVVQYTTCAILGRRVGRSVKSQLSSLVIYCLSTISAIVALAVPAKGKATGAVKIAFLFLPIAIELVGLWLQLQWNLWFIAANHMIADRYGAFSLIILGEGFSSLTSAFNHAIAGLSNRSQATYAQVCLSIGIIIMLYMFLFSWFRKNENIPPKRVLTWEGIHLPLHLSILLLLAAITNCVVSISFQHGIGVVIDAFEESLVKIATGEEVDRRDRRNIDKYLNRLALTPDWDTEFDYLSSLVNNTNPAQDFIVAAWQYLGQVIIATEATYGLDVSDPTFEKIQQLYSVNSTWSGNDTIKAQRREQTQNLILEAIFVPVSESLSGTLWLYPCAGCVLILAAIRSFLWSSQPQRSHHMIHIAMVVAGVILSLFGLFAIGNKAIVTHEGSNGEFSLSSYSPMYDLVNSNTPLVVVLVFYLAVYVGVVGVVTWLRWRRRKLSGVKSQSGKGRKRAA